MTVSLRICSDADDARHIHELAFPADEWPGDDHTYWIARDETERVVGFCSAVHRPGTNYVFLSRAAAVRGVRGQGLHRRMIKHRVMWSWFRGVEKVVTYTTLQNYASMVNLLRCGFEFYRPDEPWVGKRVHYFQMKLE